MHIIKLFKKQNTKLDFKNSNVIEDTRVKIIFALYVS
jgi:hypothetical protein